MRISPTIFRYRYGILIAILALGFWAPLDRRGGAHPGTAWLFLSGLLVRAHVLPIAAASLAVMSAAILLLLLAALLRTWAAAYRSAGAMAPAGPYRHPLYLGLWFHTLALALLMPPGGALFTVIFIALLLAFLARTAETPAALATGAAFPADLPRLPASGVQAHWGRGFLSEIYMWGVAATFITFAGRYNATLLEQGILISLGLAIVVQGFLQPASHPPTLGRPSDP